jgi:hypothetical protein
LPEESSLCCLRLSRRFDIHLTELISTLVSLGGNIESSNPMQGLLKFREWIVIIIISGMMYIASSRAEANRILVLEERLVLSRSPSVAIAQP